MKLNQLVLLIIILPGLLVLSCSSSNHFLKGKQYHPQTKDSWKLTIEHFRPLSSTKRKYPIIICHGLMANRYYFKTDKKSLVYILQSQGYDVWLMDLRGRSDAGSPSLYFGKKTYNYSMDDYIKQDMDTALSFVLKKTGAEKVNWIGHSMGGIIAYAKIGTYNENRITNLITIASPGFIGPIGKNLLFSYRMRGGMLVLPAIMTSTFTYLNSYNLLFIPSQIFETLYYAPNVSEENINKIKRYSTNNVSKKVMYQFIKSLEKGDFVSLNGKKSYTANYKNIKIPTLLISGRRDHLADPLVIRTIYDMIGSKDKTMFIASKATGLQEDYGHTDLVVGKKANVEIAPKIINWLNKRN